MHYYHHLLLRNKVTHVRVEGILPHLDRCLSGTLTETDCISWQHSKREKNNFGKATQSTFCRVEPTDRWQELNVLKKNPMAGAVLASVWYSAKLRALMNELQGAYGCFSPKELKGERVGMDELLQMMATQKVSTGICPFNTGHGREALEKKSVIL